MNLFKNIGIIIKNIYIFPYNILNKLYYIIFKHKKDEQINYLNKNESGSAFAFLISSAIWIILGYTFFRDEIRHNRIVYACPIDFRSKCSYGEAQYETLCDKDGRCWRFYTKLTISKNEIINFYYCDEPKGNTQTCYTEDSKGTWSLEYRGKTVFRK